MTDSLFHAEEEEDFILDHWAADVAAEVIEAYGGLKPGDAYRWKG